MHWSVFSLQICSPKSLKQIRCTIFRMSFVLFIWFGSVQTEIRFIFRGSPQTLFLPLLCNPDEGTSPAYTHLHQDTHIVIEKNLNEITVPIWTLKYDDGLGQFKTHLRGYLDSINIKRENHWGSKSLLVREPNIVLSVLERVLGVTLSLSPHWNTLGRHVTSRGMILNRIGPSLKPNVLLSVAFCVCLLQQYPYPV